LCLVCVHGVLHTFHVSTHCSVSVISAVQGLARDFAMQDAPSYIGDLNVRGIHRAWYALGYSIEMASLRYSEDGGVTTE